MFHEVVYPWRKGQRAREALLAIAHEADVDLTLDDFQRVGSRVPHLADVKRTVRHGAQLTQQMLAFAREGDLAPTRVDLREMILHPLAILLGEIVVSVDQRHVAQNAIDPRGNKTHEKSFL